MQSVARVGRAGWQDQEISQLKKAVQLAGGKGEPLRSVFDNIGQELGRKPNSVRNFYYASLKREEAGDVPTAAPFETFSQDEVRSLIREVLMARAKGVSVRACVQTLARGDRKLMLRYQNKYRSVLKSKPYLIREIMEEITEDGEQVFDPYAVSTLHTKPLHENITSTIVNSGDPALLGLLRGLDTLLARAGMMDAEPLKTACEPLVQSVKDFLGLTMEQREKELSAFSETLSERIGELENVMGM